MSGKPREIKELEKRIRNGRHLGYTLEFAEKTQAERHHWITGMLKAGRTDEEIQAATGLSAMGVYHRRHKAIAAGIIKPAEKPVPVPPVPVVEDSVEPETSEAGIRLDDGAYMALVRRLKVAPPPSWRFGRDLSPMPARPIVIRSNSIAGWCADEGDRGRDLAATV